MTTTTTTTTPVAVELPKEAQDAYQAAIGTINR